MIRELNFDAVRTLGDWLDYLSPARAVALHDAVPSSVSFDLALTAREVFEMIVDYNGGVTGSQVTYILADVFGW